MDAHKRTVLANICLCCYGATVIEIIYKRNSLLCTVCSVLLQVLIYFSYLNIFTNIMDSVDYQLHADSWHLHFNRQLFFGAYVMCLPTHKTISVLYHTEDRNRHSKLIINIPALPFEVL